MPTTPYNYDEVQDDAMKPAAAKKSALKIDGNRASHLKEPPKPAVVDMVVASPPDLSNAEEQLVGRRKARLQDLIQREGAGGSKSLAKRAGLVQSHINHLSLPGYHFGERAARGLEKRLGLPHMYFDQAPTAAGTVRGAPTVPIQPWADIGRYRPTPDAPSIAIPWEVGPRAVAGISHGAMWSGDGGMGIPRGWYAVIDPDVQVREGDVVAVWLPNATEATLRQFLTDGGRPLLYPLDTRNHTIEEWTRAVNVWGPVIGALRNFRT
jgi:hypothetical protein